MTETTSVTYAVDGTERVAGSGRLIALANVRIEVAGIEIMLQGLQVVRGGDGALTCKAPMWRHPKSGRWLPAVLLPPELQAAVGAEVLAAFGEQS
jgi:hypothetical protein